MVKVMFAYLIVASDFQTSPSPRAQEIFQGQEILLVLSQSRK